MNSLIKLNRSQLLSQFLIDPKYRAKAAKKINSVPNPVSFLIGQGFSLNKNFYQNLAAVFRLEYEANLPVDIGSERSIAQLVPSQVLIKNQAYLYEKEDQPLLAVTNPFIEKNAVDEILSYTRYKKCHLVIANPSEIDTALNQTYYQDLSISTEDKIHILHPEQSTKSYRTLIVSRIFPIGTLILWAGLLLLFPRPMLFIMFAILNILYFAINPYKIYIFLKSFRPFKSLKISQRKIKNVIDDELPVYTLLVPLKDEAKIVPNIVKNILKIDYPYDKLDIKFITEVTDDKTISALEKEGVGVSSVNASILTTASQLVKVPIGAISTKPRSTNYALGFARGSYTVIYDAEDNPEPTQLKKAYLGFMESKLDTICIQARLNFYNSRQNILTRLFSLEYGFWFDYYLPGLQEVASPIPLGGTSNHFITNYLKKVGTWDPYNVTEDADLGLRIYRYNYKTSIINSYTLEEANSRLGNWIKQRTRWQKGFLLTFLVHTAKPLVLLRELGLKKFVLSTFTFGSSFFLPFFNPILWFIFLISLTTLLPTYKISTPNAFFGLIALFNLIVGNLTYVIIHIISAIKNKKVNLVPFALLLPIYWMILSLATYRAAWQFITKPFYWEKTKHGLNK